MQFFIYSTKQFLYYAQAHFLPHTHSVLNSLLFDISCIHVFSTPPPPSPSPIQHSMCGISANFSVYCPQDGKLPIKRFHLLNLTDLFPLSAPSLSTPTVLLSRNAFRQMKVSSFCFKKTESSLRSQSEYVGS